MGSALDFLGLAGGNGTADYVPTTTTTTGLSLPTDGGTYRYAMRPAYGTDTVPAPPEDFVAAVDAAGAAIAGLADAGTSSAALVAEFEAALRDLYAGVRYVADAPADPPPAPAVLRRAEPGRRAIRLGELD